MLFCRDTIGRELAAHFEARLVRHRVIVEECGLLLGSQYYRTSRTMDCRLGFQQRVGATLYQHMVYAHLTAVLSGIPIDTDCIYLHLSCDYRK